MKATRVRPQRTVITDPELASSGRQPAPAKKAAGAVKKEEDRPTADENEQAREEAFQRDGYRLCGIEFVGLTSGRWSALLAQRAAVTEFSLFDAFQKPDAFFAEAIRILYFCGTSPEEWREFRRRAQEWQEEIERWADERFSRVDRFKIEDLALQIFNDAEENRHSVEPSNHATEGN